MRIERRHYHLIIVAVTPECVGGVTADGVTSVNLYYSSVIRCIRRTASRSPTRIAIVGLAATTSPSPVVRVLFVGSLRAPARSVL